MRSAEKLTKISNSPLVKKSGATYYREGLKGKKVILLNKSEAAHFLHTMYEELLEANDTIENQHPDFHSLLTENLRNPFSGSAVKAAKLRGNRDRYTRIDHMRYEGRPMYSRPALFMWFDEIYTPTLASWPLITWLDMNEPTLASRA